MKKFFIKADTVRNDAFALAKKLIDEDYIPDIMFVSMRGGAEMGNAMNEFFKFALGKNYKTIFATVVAQSYTDVQKKNDVVFDGWTYEPENVHLSHKVLVVDDICDSGATLKKISEKFRELGFEKDAVRFAVHDYKHFLYDGAASVNFVPDYFCTKHEIKNEEENIWVHYMSHELIGLSHEQFKENYLKEYPELEKIFAGIF